MVCHKYVILSIRLNILPIITTGDTSGSDGERVEEKQSFTVAILVPSHKGKLSAGTHNS